MMIWRLSSFILGKPNRPEARHYVLNKWLFYTSVHVYFTCTLVYHSIHNEHNSILHNTTLFV